MMERMKTDLEMIKVNAIGKLENYLNTGNSNVIFSKKEYMDYYT